MTPERYGEIEAKIASACSSQNYRAYPNDEAIRDIDYLLAEARRLNRALVEARLSAEEAWDDYDEKEHHDRAA